MKIYLAGKVSKNDWRHSIVAGLKETDATDNICTGCLDVPVFFPILDNAVFGEHSYTGPYFVSGLDAPVKEGDKGGEDFSALRFSRTVWRERFDAIGRSDVVFAYIDSAHCQETLVEMGYARALDVPVWVVFANESVYRESRLPACFASYFKKHRHLTYEPAMGLRLCIEADGCFVKRRADVKRNDWLEKREGELRFRRLAKAVSDTLTRAFELTNGGNAAWRELLYDAVVKPLSEALRQVGGSHQ